MSRAYNLAPRSVAYTGHCFCAAGKVLDSVVLHATKHVKYDFLRGRVDRKKKILCRHDCLGCTTLSSNFDDDQTLSHFFFFFGTESSLLVQAKNHIQNEHDDLSVNSEHNFVLSM